MGLYLDQLPSRQGTLSIVKTPKRRAAVPSRGSNKADKKVDAFVGKATYKVGKEIVSKRADFVTKGLTESVKLSDKLPQNTSHLIKAMGETPQGLKSGMAMSLSGMTEEATTKLLQLKSGDVSSADALRHTVSGLKPKDHKALARILGTLKPEDSAKLLNFTQHMDGPALQKGVKDFDAALARLGGKGNSQVADMAGKMLNASENVVSSIGVPMTAKVGGRVVSNLAKMIPVAGALPAAFSAGQNTGRALDSKLPKEIRYLGAMNAGLNTTDAALGVLEATGVGNAGLPVSLSLGIAELGLDLLTDYETDRHKAMGKNWEPTEKTNAVIAGGSFAGGVSGIGTMFATFGPQESQRKLGDLFNLTGKTIGWNLVR